MRRLLVSLLMWTKRYYDHDAQQFFMKRNMSLTVTKRELRAAIIWMNIMQAWTSVMAWNVEGVDGHLGKYINVEK